MQWYQVLEQSHTYSTSNTYKHTRIHIHTLRQIPKMGSKVRNRNLSLNHSKTLPNPTKFYQSSSFYIPYRMPIKKTPNESRTKKTFSGTVPGAGQGAGGVVRQTARARRLVSLRGFNPKTRAFTPILQIWPFPTKIKFIQFPHTFNYIL